MRELFSRAVYAVSTVLEYYIFNKLSKPRHNRFPLFPAFVLGCAICLTGLQNLAAQSLPLSSGLSSLERTRAEVEQTERLVADGTLPRVKLDEVRQRLADAEDEALLSRTLFGLRTPGSITEEEAKEMIAAAQRRVDRARAVLNDRQKLLDSGAIGRVDFESSSRELEDRERTLGFAKDRLRLLNELAAMAESERELAKSAEAASFKNSVIRSDGNGSFSLGDLTPIQAEFEKKFHRALPISALGQTLTHQSLGLDHKDRVDVALSPREPEGIWLLALLNRLHVPYLAFRTAVAGAATAPHIHIGVGSSRLQAVFSPSSTHTLYSPKVR